MEAAVAYYAVALTVAALVLMIDAARSERRCRECDHCKRAAQVDRERLAEARHETWHRERQYTSAVPASQCSDPECPGRAR